MPNWCTTDITFYSQNKNQIKELFDCINNVMKKPSEGQDFGEGWLGDFGIEIFGKDYESQDILMRGKIDDIDKDIKSKKLDDKTFYYFAISEYSAWSSAVQLWIKYLDFKEFEDIDIACISEESGMELYIKYDNPLLKFYPQKYKVDINLDGDADKKYGNMLDNCLYESVEQIVDDCNEIFGISLSKTISIKELEKKINGILEKIDDDSCFIIYEFEEEDLNDFS